MRGLQHALVRQPMSLSDKQRQQQQQQLRQAQQQSPPRSRLQSRQRPGMLLFVVLQWLSVSLLVLPGSFPCASSSAFGGNYVRRRAASATPITIDVNYTNGTVILISTTTTTTVGSNAITTVDNDDGKDNNDDTAYPHDESWQTASNAPTFNQNEDDDGERYEPDKGVEEGAEDDSIDDNSTMNQEDNDDVVANSSFPVMPPASPFHPDHPEDNLTNHTVHFDLYVALPPRSNGVGHLLKPTVTYYLNLISTVYHVEMTPDDPDEAMLLDELGDAFGMPASAHDQNVTVDLVLVPHLYTKIIYKEETQWWWRYPFRYMAQWHDTETLVDDVALQKAQTEVYGYLLQATEHQDVLRDKLFMLMHDVLKKKTVAVYQVLLTPPWPTQPHHSDSADMESRPPQPPPCNGDGKSDCIDVSCGTDQPCHDNDDDHEKPSAGDDDRVVGCDDEQGLEWQDSGGAPCSRNNNTSNPNGGGVSNNINLVTPLDAREWDWRRYLGLGILLGTVSGTLCLAQLAALRRHHRIQQELWGRKSEEEKEKQKHLYLGTEEGVNALLRMGWNIQGSKMEIYIKNDQSLYEESMLMGGCEPKESAVATAPVTGTTATPSETTRDTIHLSS